MMVRLVVRVQWWRRARSSRVKDGDSELVPKVATVKSDVAGGELVEAAL